MLWPPHAKSQLIGKGPDAGKDWGQEEKGVTENEMVGWHHRLNGHEFEQAPGDVKKKEALCATALGVRKSQTWLSNWTTRGRSFWLIFIQNFSFPCVKAFCRNLPLHTCNLNQSIDTQMEISTNLSEHVLELLIQSWHHQFTILETI